MPKRLLIALTLVVLTGPSLSAKSKLGIRTLHKTRAQKTTISSSLTPLLYADQIFHLNPKNQILYFEALQKFVESRQPREPSFSQLLLDFALSFEVAHAVDETECSRQVVNQPRPGEECVRWVLDQIRSGEEGWTNCSLVGDHLLCPAKLSFNLPESFDRTTVVEALRVTRAPRDPSITRATPDPALRDQPPARIEAPAPPTPRPGVAAPPRPTAVARPTTPPPPPAPVAPVLRDGESPAGPEEMAGALVALMM